jgi:adenylosuccinate lyase
MLGHHLLGQKSLLRGLTAVAPDAEAMAADLDASWEVVGEAVQTILRRYGRTDAYELLKEATRGKQVIAEVYRRLCDELPDLPREARELIARVEPGNYIGAATRLAEEFAAKMLGANS